LTGDYLYGEIKILNPKVPENDVITGRSLGTYRSKEEAEKRLTQIEMFKHIKVVLI
jgi:hypothetical protein